MSSTTYTPRVRNYGAFGDRAKNKLAAKAAPGAPGMGKKTVKGQYDELRLGDNPVWLRFHKTNFTQSIYDRQAQQVVECDNSWFEFTQHYVAATNRSFVCSAGADRSKPCRGCSVRSSHFNRLRVMESATGVREKKEPPISASTRYAFSVACLEKIIKVPVLDKKTGDQRKNRNGELLFNDVPAPLTKLTLQERKSAEGDLGKAYHMNLSGQQLGQLDAIDEELSLVCASCTEELYVFQVTCEGCGAVVFEDEQGIRGQDIKDLRKEPFDCGACGHHGPGVVEHACACENPVPGGLHAFDVRLSGVSMPGEKGRVLRLDDFRLPDYRKLFDINDAFYIETLAKEPLDLAAIYGPSSIEAQKSMMTTEHANMGADAHLEGRSSSPYGSSPNEEDPNKMKFD